MKPLDLDAIQARVREAEVAPGSTWGIHYITDVPALVDEVGAAREVVEAFRKFRDLELGYDIWGTEAEAAWIAASAVLANYDKVVSEVERGGS